MRAHRGLMLHERQDAPLQKGDMQRRIHRQLVTPHQQTCALLDILAQHGREQQYWRRLSSRRRVATKLHSPLSLNMSSRMVVVSHAWKSRTEGRAVPWQERQACQHKETNPYHLHAPHLLLLPLSWSLERKPQTDQQHINGCKYESTVSAPAATGTKECRFVTFGGLRSARLHSAVASTTP